MRRRLARGLGAVGALALAGAAVVALRGDGPADTRACLPADRELSARAAPPDASSDGSSDAARSGTLLVANQFAGTTSLVDLATGKVTHLRTGEDPHEVAISPDGRWGVVSNFGPVRDGRYLGNRLFVIEIAARRVVRTIETGEDRGLHDLAFRPDFPMRVLVTAQTSRRVLEVDVAVGAVVGAVDTRGDRSHMLAVTRDGRTAFTTNEGTGTVSRLDLTRRAFVASFPASENVEGIAVSADGRELWVGESAWGAVTVRDAATGAVLATLGGFRYPVRLTTTPDGGRVVISDPGCRAIVEADAATRRVLRVTQVPLDPPVFVGDVAPDGRTAFASVRHDRAALVLDLEAGAVLGRHPAGWAADGIAWGPAPR